jgi:septum formation protein
VAGAGPVTPRQTLILASASPRRAELLRAAGIAFDIHVSDVDETLAPDEAAPDFVRRLAKAKARPIAELFPGRAVLGADTVVVVEGTVLGKPDDQEDARQMLQLLSDRTHQVLTGVCLIGPAVSGSSEAQRSVGGRYVGVEVARTTVEFASLSPAEIDWYVASGEPMDKAGAYAIQGLASRFVSRIDGSYSNVVGLPVALVARMCTAAGILLS